MTQRHIPGDNFEERLLARLKAEVAERSAGQDVFADGGPDLQVQGRRAPRLVFSAVAVVVSLAAAVAMTAGGDNTPAAFAVEAESNGDIRVEIRSLEDAKGLENALEGVGIPASVNFLATGMACKEPRFERAPWPDGERVILIGPGPGSGPGPFVFSVGSGTVGPGQTLVITASGNLGVGTQVDVAEGTVAPCEPIPRPSSASTATW